MSYRPFDDPACRGHHDLFFPTTGENLDVKARRITQAKDICATCPARLPCRDIGRTGREIGIWGGETDAERALAGFVPVLSTDRDVERVQREANASREVDRHRTLRQYRHSLEGRAS